MLVGTYRYLYITTNLSHICCASKCCKSPFDVNSVAKEAVSFVFSRSPPSPDQTSMVVISSSLLNNTFSVASSDAHQVVGESKQEALVGFGLFLLVVICK